MIQLSVSPGMSAYRALAGTLAAQIARGEYDENTPLPTEKSLVDKLGLSRQTVRRAFQELVAADLVYRVPGKGTFPVARDRNYAKTVATVDDLLALPLDTEMEIVQPLQGDYLAEAAEALGLTVRQMYSMQFVRRHQGHVFCWTTDYFPSAIGLGLEAYEPFTMAGHIGTETGIGVLEVQGHHVAGADQAITAVAATAEHARHLGCEIGAPLLAIRRTYIDGRGIPIEYAISYYLPDYYTHRQRLGRASAVAAHTQQKEGL
ncbi:MAG: GntR family transcriptional regulator [Dermatophilus congolensis]|nr:GntR family transcriptional regulator [Dermatophilus congolensis]